MGKLYLNGRYFLCRHCYRLANACQVESPTYRKRRRAGRLRQRMGGDSGCDARYPSRPKGMWRRTYDRKIAETDRLVDAAEAEWSRFFIRWFGTADLLRLMDG